MIKLNFHHITQNQIEALNEVKDILGIELDRSGFPIYSKKSDFNIEVTVNDLEGTIEYASEYQFIRAVGLLVENLKKVKVFHVVEKPIYERLGVMVDCSRNAVMNKESFQRLVQYLALMGYCSIQLYMEDTFEVNNYPYVGYLRGRYSKNELKDMDKYSSLFSIELIPAIQTLAHLGQALKWKTMENMVDVDDILLIDDERTYDFINAMLETISECFTSKTINIGMDEAHMVGLGKYLDQHGYVNRSELMIKHFGQVMEIVRKYEFKAMMWSDMFFRLANGGEYYATDCEFDPEILNNIPEDVSLAYWDYYSQDQKIYDNMIKKHQELSSNIVFAAGAWKWMGYSPNSHFSEEVGRIAHESCKQNNINEVLVTIWGDNGAECSLFSVLPALMMWAEMNYEDNSSDLHMKKRFLTCTNMCYNDFMNLDLLMLTPDNISPGVNSVNPPKYIFYQDILLGLFDKHINEITYKEHFHSCAEIFHAMKQRNGDFNYIYETQYMLSKILEIKCNAGIEIRRAYKENNTELLKTYANTILPKLVEYMNEFIKVYQKQWLIENKVFGLEVIELRLGGMLQRVNTAIQRILAYLNMHIDKIDELEETLLYFDGRKEKGDGAISVPLWHKMVTPSIISHI